MALAMTSGDEPDQRHHQTSTPDRASGDVGFAAPSAMSSAGMFNVDVNGEAGAHRVLMVRFPRAKVALGSGLITLIILGLPWLIVPFFKNDSGLPGWAVSLTVVIVLALAFGWILVPLLITAVRGGYVALTPTGVLMKTGLNSVLVPWGAIESVAADTTTMAVVFTTPGATNEYALLRLRLRSEEHVAGWPWPAALSPVLLGSSRRTLRIPAWWIQPVQLNWIVALLGFLVSHPEEREKIGNADPGRWDISAAQD